MLIVTYRPEYSHGWTDKSYYTHLRLEPLDRVAAGEVINSILGTDKSVAPLARLIFEKTEGNPFFIEEITQALFQDGAVRRDGGIVKLARPLATIRLPATVQAMLAARIDRLTAVEKDLLQTLAVVGSEVPLAIVERVSNVGKMELSDPFEPAAERVHLC